MRPHRTFHRRHTCTATAACCVSVAALFGAPSADAHTLSVTQGTATIEQNVLTIRFALHAEDLRHSFLPGTPDDVTYSLREVQSAAAEYGAALLARIVVRSGRGDTITGRIDPPELETATGAATITAGQLPQWHVGYTLSYPLHGECSHLSLQQIPSGPTHAAPSQIVLTFRSEGLPPQTIRLTGGGNVEIVRLTTPRPCDSSAKGRVLDAHGTPCDRYRFVLSEAEQTVRATVQVDGKGVRVELFLPVQILETWIALPRAHRDYFESAEQDAAQNEVRTFLATHNRMYINEDLAKPRIERVAFLGVGDSKPSDVTQGERASAWTSRIYASIQYASDEAPSRIELHWDLFNSAILTAEALLAVDSDCQEHEISTYQPSVSWTRE